MRTTYILDTNVLISDPEAFKNFPEGDVLLPITVLDELDKLKKQSNEVGRNARVATKLIDEVSDLGDISIGVLIDQTDSLLKIDVNSYQTVGDALYGDTRILACAQENAKSKKDEVILVSNDINMRVRAKALGIKTQSYNKEKADVSDLYSGVKKINNDEALDDLLTNHSIHAASYGIELCPNECAVFLDDLGNEMAKARQIGRSDLRLIKKSYPWGISPRNTEQELAIDMLMDPKLPLITMTGKSGCGKSLINCAAGLEQVIEKHVYDKMIIYRPMQAVGAELGFLPGEISDKIGPWFQAVMDSFEVLFRAQKKNWRKNLEMYISDGLIEFSPLTYIRGRSISKTFMIVDESQNLSPNEMKAILTRAGEGTKIILNGDVDQIDTPKLDALNNGLTYTIDKFKNSNLAGHITFVNGERSELASAAAELM